MSDDFTPDAVLTTDVPGLVLWRHPRRTIAGKRFRPYVVTHEASGVALLSSSDGKARCSRTKAEALETARLLGDVLWRGKPVDWTQPVDVLRKCDRAVMACHLVAGWRYVAYDYDKATRKWAERNGLDLSLGGLRRAS